MLATVVKHFHPLQITQTSHRLPVWQPCCSTDWNNWWTEDTREGVVRGDEPWMWEGPDYWEAWISLSRWWGASGGERIASVYFLGFLGWGPVQVMAGCLQLWFLLSSLSHLTEALISMSLQFMHVLGMFHPLEQLTLWNFLSLTTVGTAHFILHPIPPLLDAPGCPVTTCLGWNFQCWAGRR